MPSLIRELAVAGSRKSDGTANASGKVFLYEPGTTTIVAGYRDDSLSEAWPRVGGGIPLDAGGRVKIWINDTVDVAITDADGATIDYMLGYNKTRAEQVEVENDLFTGALTDESGAVSQALGGKTDLQTLMTRAATSIGPDFKYLESTGATARTVQAKFSEIAVSVKDFGARGDGIADDTTAMQQAVSRIQARGGGVLYLPAGTYKHTTAFAFSNVDGITVQGAGSDATFLRGSSGTANCFTVTSCNSFHVRGLSFTHASTSTGSALSLTTCDSAVVDDVVHLGGSGSNYRFGATLTGSPSFFGINSTLESEASNAASRGILATNSGPLKLVGVRLAAAAGYPFEAAGTTGTVTFVAGDFAGGSPRYANGLSGSNFVFIGCVSVGVHSVATATIPVIIQVASAPLESTTSSAVGAAQTPSLLGGPSIKLTAASGGAGTVTVAAPAVLPVASAGQFWDFRFVNASGGAVTWSLNAVYKFNAIPTTDAHTICVRAFWDGTVLREMARADTST